VEDCLTLTEANRNLNAFLWADPDRVIAMLPPRPSGPLAGLPIALKDNIDTAGIPTTSGSMVDRDRVPSRDAAVWLRLRDSAGAVLLGKTHLSEFAYRSHHPALGWVRNPRNPDRATGGSSSGSAAAVAAGLVPAALGTDTGGSIRIPAAYCGIVGLKGTVGAVETTGVVPLSTTTDHVGVLARSVTDAAIVFQQASARRLDLVDPLTGGIRRPAPRSLRIGIERDFFVAGAQPAVLDGWERAARALEKAGCEMIPIRVPQAAGWRLAQRTILLHEAWTYHAPRLRTDAPYGPVFRAAVTRGSVITVNQYQQALRVRQEAIRFMASVFDNADVILTPTCPTVAPAKEEGTRSVLFNRFTTLAAFAGLPAISIPSSTGYLGLPVGVQLIGAANAERKVVEVAALLEALLESV
jgi:aspartyl-tRNA(Asn)/glutamyl-tRNA(Gln) amidotransferase subunit A